MSASVRASVRMFREPGYAWVSVQVQALLDQAVRVMDQVEDPMDMATQLADVAELVAQQLRDLGAEALLERAS